MSHCDGGKGQFVLQSSLMLHHQRSSKHDGRRTCYMRQLLSTVQQVLDITTALVPKQIVITSRCCQIDVTTSATKMSL